MQFNYFNLPKFIKSDLDKYKSQIIVRFPPEPNGYLHLGHIKALSINYCIAKKYNGKLIFRLDNTNPIEESDEFEKALIDDINTLNVKYDQLTHTSDYFDEILKCAEILYKNNYAYLDFTDMQTIKDMRNSGTETKYRSEDNNSDNWDKFIKGDLKGACLRLKIDMTHKNKALRDPIIYRYINNKIYPTYDFACPITDNIEKITHVFRSTEFNERDELYVFILEKLKLSIPKLYHYGKINITGAELSKRKIKQMILDGKISGYDDHNLYTLRGMLKRGMTFEALDLIMKETGYPNGCITLEPSIIWSINKKTIDKLCSRMTIIDKYQKVNLDIDNYDAKQIPKFIKNQELGTRTLYFSKEILIEDFPISEGDTVTLFNLGKVILKDGVLMQDKNNTEQTKGCLLWIAADKTITVIIDNNTYIGEASILELDIGSFVQFYKKNYYRLVEKTDNKKL